MRYNIYGPSPRLHPHKLGKTFYFTKTDLDAFIASRGSAGHRRNLPGAQGTRAKNTRPQRKRKNRGAK